MIKKLINDVVIMTVILFTTMASRAQNSLLVNFGTSSCAGSAEPAFSLIRDPLTDTTSSLISCSLSNQVPDIYAVFIAYNPKENSLYLADIRSGVNTKIWKLNIGLPVSINCPSLDSVPDYSYRYISNNFEFDNNGNLWSFSNYNDSLGQCNIDNFDVATGAILSTRIVQFPDGYFPTSISSGDLTILPNGRMFATLGSFPSKLFEIKNYNTTSNATAVFLDSLPQSCYGIAYLNGLLELTGTDFFGNCYYYAYHISDGTLDSAKSFQAGQFPIDNTSITPSLGLAKQLVNRVKVNENTADLTYEIYAKNLGNVALNNINISDNLASVFGAQNVSNVGVTFTADGNAADLRLNSSYNGISDTLLLTPGQNLNNQVGNSEDYFVKLRITFRVSNLNNAAIYENSAIGTATIGSVGTSSFSNVADSSNNGPASAVDPNNDGNATEPGENNPTPFNFGALPVKFISVNASLVNSTTAAITWKIATPTVNANSFEIEYSADSKNWSIIGNINITDENQSGYKFLHKNIPVGKLFYRIKERDIDGNFIYSPVVMLINSLERSLIVYPNPADASIVIITPAKDIESSLEILYDGTGRQVMSLTTNGGTNHINTSQLPSGIYILKLINANTVASRKIIIRH